MWACAWHILMRLSRVPPPPRFGTERTSTVSTSRPGSSGTGSEVSPSNGIKPSRNILAAVIVNAALRCGLDSLRIRIATARRLKPVSSCTSSSRSSHGSQRLRKTSNLRVGKSSKMSGTRFLGCPFTLFFFFFCCCCCALFFLTASIRCANCCCFCCRSASSSAAVRPEGDRPPRPESVSREYSKARVEESSFMLKTITPDSTASSRPALFACLHTSLLASRSP
mmetsp:Transcript_19868/g.38953  ORF Transcript_19868/g.38953 Transcript_19868/m.38953 type:complete len:224 (-) Transcript_19868:23-694(-)